ncbi:MAG TPA: hypothetical protein VLW17_03825, partial [Thermoanaerobaculaceae bacterium]|nr:hypothetical protein [Thermoanaerobaculaceae bacterium]
RYDRTDAPVLDLLGVRVVTSRRPLAAPNLELVGRVGEGYLYRNPTALPGAWAPEEVRIVPDEDRARDAMLRADFRPARVAFVEAPADTSDAAAHGTVVLARPAPGRLRLTAALEKGGVVVIGEGYDRGWRAAERGRDLRLYPCDLAVMAVELPAGHHEVELRFRPRVWRLALAMSALGAACAAAVLLLARR